MKTLHVIVVTVLVLLIPSYALPAVPGWMRMSLIEGDVQIMTTDSGDWGPATLNGPVIEGDQIWVPGGGRAELQLNSGTYIRLDENSALQILATEEESAQFYLSQGHAYVYFDAPRGSVIQVDTPDVSVRAFDSAVFRLDMSDQYEYTDVAVYKGYVETENQLGRTRINAGEMISLAQDTNGEVAPMGPPDEWERWNKRRNDTIARRGVSQQYLPPELRAYSYDLDAGGRWVNVPDYGYCWTPTVFFGSSWAPYHYGRWIWRGGEYIWVSYDPWGWAPYHYGRWTFVVSIGWCWVPPVAGDVYWGPGYVGWVSTGSYVAWVPLAPGEIYYGRGYYGRHSVNITNINISQVNITNVYKNVYVTNAATVVSRGTFATASPKIVRMNRSTIEGQIFTRKNISVGTPSIRHTKGSYFASSKRIPAAKLPPRTIRHVEIKELKRLRPFVKSPERSVLKPGARPGQLPLQKVRTPRTPGIGKPEIKGIRPIERGQPRILERRPAPKEERPEVKPERKPVPAERFAPGGGKPEVKPERRPAPSERFAPRGGKPEVKPERKPAPTERAPRQEMPQVRPERKPAPAERFAPGGGKPEVKPERKPAPTERAPRQEMPQVRPERRPAPSEHFAPRSGKPEVKPERKPTPTERAPREEIPQMKPQQRSAPTEHAPRQEMPQVRPERTKPAPPEHLRGPQEDKKIPGQQEDQGKKPKTEE